MWTIEQLKKLSEGAGGTCFDTDAHPDRHFDSHIHEGSDGKHILFVYEEGGVYYVRSFCAHEGNGRGHTNQVGPPLRTAEAAHLLAEANVMFNKAMADTMFLKKKLDEAEASTPAPGDVVSGVGGEIQYLDPDLDKLGKGE